MWKKGSKKRFWAAGCAGILLLAGLLTGVFLLKETPAAAQDDGDSGAKLIRLTDDGEEELKDGGNYEGDIRVYVDCEGEYLLNVQKSVQGEQDRWLVYTSLIQGKKPIDLKVGAKETAYQFALVCKNETKRYRIVLSVEEEEKEPEIRGTGDEKTGFSSDITIGVPDGCDARIEGDAADEAVEKKSDKEIVISRLYSDETYEVISKDKKGNEKSKTISIKGKTIAEKKTLSLKTGKVYHLGSGQWKIDGDETVYEGNQDFSACENGQFEFKPIGGEK